MSPQPPPHRGELNFNAQHSPMGAFMSFTCGHAGTGGGIGVEIGRPASQNIFVGIKRGDRKSSHPVRCLPFLRRTNSTGQSAANYDVEHAKPPLPDRFYECYSSEQITRHYGWATDRWVTPDFSFTLHTPFGPIPEPGTDEPGLRAALLPAIIGTLEVDNRNGKETKTAVFALDFGEPGARILSADDATSLGFAWRRSMGVLGTVEESAGVPRDAADRGLFALQRWSVAEGLSDVNPVHALGTSAGLALEVPPGTSRTLVLAIGVHLDGIVTTRLEGRYYYTRYYASLDEVLASAIQQATPLRARAAELDAELLSSKLSADQQFLIAHATRSYYGSTQLLDVGGEPFWLVNEGEYCMMNTLDLSIDQAFWELRNNPWVVRNILTNFVRYYAYYDQVQGRNGQLLPGGISFAHDMGVNNNFSPAGRSSYELAQLNGCFSFMTQEQLCNWVLTAACYVASTGDTQWLLQNAYLLSACADSLRARANPRTGVMAYDSALCAGGKEITTYDSLDESLGQARANSYLAVKCWATWIGLELLWRLSTAAGGQGYVGDAGARASLSEQLANHLCKCAGPDGALPAVMEEDNAGYESRIFPAIEGLIYPAYWLDCLAGMNAPAGDDARRLLRDALAHPLVDTLRRHTLALLNDPARRNVFEDGGIKLSSTSNNSWMSKIALFQYICRAVLRLDSTDAHVTKTFAAADSAHVRWQTAGSAYWACSDQFIKGHAKGSRYYPRIITAALWLDEKPAPSTVTDRRPATATPSHS